MSTKFFNNEGENTLIRKFEGVFQYDKAVAFFDALIGYFRSSGYFRFRKLLDNIRKIRILVGINSDEILARYGTADQLLKGDDDATRAEALRQMRKDIATCSYRKEVEDGIAQFVADIATGKVEIRAHKTRKLHAKIYIMRPDPWNEHCSGSVITGSSNLTAAGLGIQQISNYEFNVLLRDYDDVKFASDEFERLWNEGAILQPGAIQDALIKKTHLNNGITPSDLYYKFLAEYFGSLVDSDNAEGLPRGFDKLQYQTDAVAQGFEKLRKNNGFFLSDVVGLGKTVIALLIARKFFFANNYPSHNSRTLIVCPPAMKNSWEETAEKFGLSCKIRTNGSLDKEKGKKYDLILVDEAHKFRNENTYGYGELQQLTKRAPEPGGCIGDPLRPKVILISATPLNNSPKDIQNQTYLFQDPGATSLDLPNLGDFFQEIQKRHIAASKMAKEDFEAAKPEFQAINEELREKVISPLTIRRTRADLENNEAYRNDLLAHKVRFPELHDGKPNMLFYALGSKVDDLFDSTLDLLGRQGKTERDLPALTYSRYAVPSYLVEEKKKEYVNEIADRSGEQLKRIMRLLLLKRLDSSFHAFKMSIEKALQGVESMLKMLDNDTVYILSDKKVSELVQLDDWDKLEQIYQDGCENNPAYKCYCAADFLPEFRDDLENDREILSDLFRKWSKITADPKYDLLLLTIKKELLDKTKNPSGKAVIFSESQDTTDYLVDRLLKDGFSRVLSVSAGTRSQALEAIRQNFDANIPKAEQRSAYDLLISTEVLSEGVNLHRAAVVVNYDTPWNATRLMQRVGRVNRIGSPNTEYWIYNFFPTREINDQIKLEENARRKLWSFHHALGDDSQIYSADDAKPETFGLFDAAQTGEVDKKLPLLLKVRKFKEENPKRYEEIKNLPLKLRLPRKQTPASQKAGATPLTVAFLKNGDRHLFYQVGGGEGGTPREISFLQAEELLRAEQDEERVAAKMPAEHYSHVEACTQDFVQRAKSDASKKDTPVGKLGNDAKHALTYLSAFLQEGLDYVSDDDRMLLQRGIDDLKKQAHAKLPKEIKKIAKNGMQPFRNLSAIRRTLLDILGEEVVANAPEGELRPVRNDSPDIVLSETFLGD